jgi:hypothetical protein
VRERALAQYSGFSITNVRFRDRNDRPSMRATAAIIVAITGALR